MQKNEIRIGDTYTAKVTHREVAVRIDRESEHGGWTATNLSTGKAVRIKTAARLRREVSREELQNGTAPGMDRQPTRRFRAVTPEPKVEPVRQPKLPRPTRAKRGPKLSALAAAHRVLQEADSPMNCKQITETAARQGYWRSKAATPWATLHAAMSREIANKGADARFRKVARGKFAANPSSAAPRVFH